MLKSYFKKPLFLFGLLIFLSSCGNYKKSDFSEEEIPEVIAFVEKFMKLRIERSNENFIALVENKDHFLSNKYLERFKPTVAPNSGELDKSYLLEKLFGNETRKFKSCNIGKPISKATGEHTDGKQMGTTLGVAVRVSIDLEDENGNPGGTLNETLLIVKDGTRDNRLAIDDLILDGEARQVN